MTALVTGLGGFAGGPLVKRLLTGGRGVPAVEVIPLEPWHQADGEAESMLSVLTSARIHGQASVQTAP